MKVLVTGGRDYRDLERVDVELRRLWPTLVIHGNHSGADTLAAQWAAEVGVPVCGFQAHWRKHGKSAGPRRNAWMLEFGKPDLVLAFPGGKGTKDMTTKAEAAGVPVVYVGETVEDA